VNAKWMDEFLFSIDLAAMWREVEEILTNSTPTN